MKAFSRRGVPTAAFFALVLAAPRPSIAQRNQPGQDTPRILIATFRTSDSDPTIGVQVADAVRSRVQDEVPVKQLWVLSKNDINNYLTSSGYKADSALSPMDLKELGKLMRADEILDGIATKTATGVKVEPRLLMTRDISQAQPLPPVEARNAGDAAKQVEKELSDAFKQLDANKKCENDARAAKYDQAIIDAKEGIRLYPQGVFARLCYMTALGLMKAPPDSILRITNEILQIDPKDKLALVNAIDAYRAKGDTAKAVQLSIQLYRADPSNQQLIQGIINDVARMGKPEVALPLIDDLLKDNPGDPQLLQTKWKLLLAAKRWKEALATGEEYAKADTSAATADFFNRQILAASNDSQPQVAAQIAARGVQKFPKDEGMWVAYASLLRKAGQLQPAVAAAQKAVQLDPKDHNAWLLIAVTQQELKQPDSVLATVRRAIAAGQDKATFGNFILQQAKDAFTHADSTKTVEDWTKALQVAQTADSLNPSPTAKFFIGVSSFQAGAQIIQQAQKEKSCDLLKKADAMFTLTQLNMPAGGSIDAKTAQTILGYVPQMTDAIPKMSKAYKCAP